VTSLSLETREEGNSVRIAIAGELDLSSALTFDEEMRRAEERSPATLVLDLRRLRFMDSTGLRLIMSAQARSRTRGRRFAVVLGSDPVKRLFRLAGVSRRLEIVEHPSAVLDPPAQTAYSSRSSWSGSGGAGGPPTATGSPGAGRACSISAGIRAKSSRRRSRTDGVRSAAAGWKSG
jgi:anti-sigma B factor antagonist